MMMMVKTSRYLVEARKHAQDMWQRAVGTLLEAFTCCSFLGWGSFSTSCFSRSTDFPPGSDFQPQLHSGIIWDFKRLMPKFNPRIFTNFSGNPSTQSQAGIIVWVLATRYDWSTSNTLKCLELFRNAVSVLIPELSNQN